MTKYFILKLAIPFFFSLFIAVNAFSQLPAGKDISFCSNEPVDLHIYKGISDLPIPDADEYIIGSATIANLNDTDGDEIIDGDVKEIEITSHNGRGETNDKDLIRLSLRRPNGSLNNEEVKLSFPKGGSKIKLWKFRNKMEAAKLIYKCSELPIDVFVEALQPSESVRDIEIKMDYKTQSDIVSITAIWVEFKKSWHTRCPFNDPSCDQGTANPVAGANSG